MSNETTFTKRSNPVKTVSAWLGIAAIVLGLTAGLSKAYYETPLKLQGHDKQLEELKATDAGLSREMREQRDLLMEIRSDIKYLRRDRNNNNGN